MRFNNFFRKRSSTSILIVIVLLSLISITVSDKQTSFDPKKAGSAFFSIFQIGFSRTAGFFGDTINSINELRKLKNEYDSLRQKVNDYQVLQRDIVKLKLENKALKEQLDFSAIIDFKYKSAQIIAQEPGNLFKTIVIDAGTKKGIQQYMPVIAFQDGMQGLVGRIIEVSSYTAKILPIFDTNSYVGARMQKVRYEGLVNGNGNKYGYLIMNYVKKSAKEHIKFGDIVVTSGMRSLYPRGINIGRVREMDNSEWQPSLQLKLEPIIDFSRLEYVFVVTGEGE